MPMCQVVFNVRGNSSGCPRRYEPTASLAASHSHLSYYDAVAVATVFIEHAGSS